MTVGYDISLATPDDISGILVLQEPNLPDMGGSLSVRLTEDWFRRAISEKSVVVGRRNGKVVGYVSDKSTCGDYPDDVACFPSFTRLLSLWPGLRCGYRARQRSRWRDVPDIAEAQERPSRDDVREGRQ